MAKQQRKAEVSLAELQKAEDDLRIAMLQTQGVIDEYSLLCRPLTETSPWIKP